jgi:hypothetical protein
MNILVHPSYNATTSSGDVAVLLLATTVDVTSVVRPVCLWGHDNSYPADIINEAGLVRFQTASFYDPLRNQAIQNTNTYT